MTAPSSRPVEVINGWFVLRAVLKALVLFALFNGIYVIIQPVKNGLLPTVYNGLVPGRMRFEQEYAANINQMFNDHVIRYATSDTYNVLFLGSSEVWGNNTQADLAIPNVLDSFSLSTSSGKPVRVYNVAFPFPDAFKDLVILQYLYDQKIPIDLVVVPTNQLSFSWHSIHPIVVSNISYAQYVVDLYDLDGSQLLPPLTTYKGWFWADRVALGHWLINQFLSPRWLIVKRDREFAPPLPLNKIYDLTSLPIDTRPGIIPVFAKFHQKTGVSVLMMVMPAPFQKNVFQEWLLEQTSQVQLPFLDCSHTFLAPGAYVDKIHILPEMQAPMARILARQLVDPTAARLAPDLPLRLTVPLQQDEEICIYHQAANA